MPKYYDSWESDAVTCGSCGWKGLGNQCVQGEMYRDLFELNCPNCSRQLVTVTYPTIEESRENWDKVSDADKVMIEAREAFLDRAEKTCLKSADQLPDLDGEELVLIWDQQSVDGRSETVIRFGNQTVWREPAFYEGYMRFIEVMKILASKYGSRLKDLVPTQRSFHDLWGDCLRAPGLIDEARTELRHTTARD